MRAITNSFDHHLFKFTNLDLTYSNQDSVLVKVLYAGLCKTDIHILQGFIKRSDNWIVGHEFCGEIIQSTNPIWKVGTLVTANPMICGESCNIDCMLGRDRNGCFAEYVSIPIHALYKLPNELRNEVGAFIEPIAAAYAAYDNVYTSWINTSYLKNVENYQVGIFGNGRMAKLLQLIIGNKFNAEIIKDPNKKYNCVIESDPTHLNDALYHVVQGGSLILKSRYHSNVQFDINYAVMNNITCRACRYSDFNKAILFAKNNIAILKTMINVYDFYNDDSVYEMFDTINSVEKKQILDFTNSK